MAHGRAKAEKLGRFQVLEGLIDAAASLQPQDTVAGV